MGGGGDGGLEGVEEVGVRILGIGNGEGRWGGVRVGGVDRGGEGMEVKWEGEDGVRVVEVDVFGEDRGVFGWNG